MAGNGSGISRAGLVTSGGMGGRRKEEGGGRGNVHVTSDVNR